MADIQFTDEELALLKGPAGEDSTVPGPDGKSAYEIAQDNGFEGTEAEWLESLHGDPGDGKSAYQSWLDAGNDGTEADFVQWLKGPPGVSAIAGVVQMDSFPGTTDDAKMANAIAFSKAQPKWPAIQLPARDIKLTKTINLYTGFRLIAPFGSDTPKNIELVNGVRYATHRIMLARDMLLFKGVGDLYDVHIENLVVQGDFTQQFLEHASGTLYASVIRGITAYGVKSTLGSHTVPARLTQCTTDGHWQIVGPRTCQVRILGSDNHLWDNGYLNIGGNAAAIPTDEYIVWVDGMGKTAIGPMYITCGSGNGLRLRGGAEGGLTVRSAVIEGYHASQPADQLVRVDGGMVNLQNLELGWANAAILVNGGLVRVRDTNYYQDSAHKNVPLVNRVGGTVLQSGTATSWGTLTP